LATAAACTAFASLRGQPNSVRADTPPPVLDIWTFGRNRVGQLGSVPPNNTIPWPMHEARHWVAVSAGREHTIAVTDQGDVYAWGTNVKGQLGDGTTRDSFLPVQVVGLTGVTLVAAGGDHNLAYRASDSTLWAWGDNSVGQLAQPASVALSAIPIAIAGAGPLAAIAAGTQHSMALGTDGTIYTWGNNLRGQLGLGDVAIRYSPTPVPMPGPVIAIGAGSAHSIAVTAGDGQAWTWGWNVFGQLGNGLQGAPTQASPNPTPALGVRGVDQVTGGDFHSLARTTDGHVWAWGYNTEGQVGNGAHTPANTGVLTPVLLDGIDSVATLDAGGIHSIALRINGEVWAWGNNQFGACGTNGRGDLLVPRPVLGGMRGTVASAGGYHSVVLSAPRAVARALQVGDDSADAGPISLPFVRPLDGPLDVTAVAAGLHHGLALDGEHRVWSWGDDSSGQLGTDDGSHESPELLDMPLDGTPGFVQVAARARQSFALRSDGAVFAWGDNSYGELGDGSVKDQHRPERISISRAVNVGAGEHHTIALDQDGAVWAWGQNRSGQLGKAPSSALVRSPTQIPGLYGITTVAAGGFHNAAIDLEGTLVLWGDGSHAQLGTGGIYGSADVVNAALPTDVVMVSLGQFHTLAVRAGGSLWSFGASNACQLGEGTVPGIWDPMRVTSPESAVLVAAGDYHSLAVSADGRVYGWGDDSRGALGTEGPPFPHFGCSPVVTSQASAVVAAGGGAFSLVVSVP
jgi:alpha-tubulin suppressor-like RCC1 family protein